MIFRETELYNFDQWINSAMGRACIQSEALQLGPWVKRVFGYHCVMLGEPEWSQCLQDNPIHHTLCINPTNPRGKANSIAGMVPELSLVTAEWNALPIDQDAVDVVFLAHVLERHSFPHEILREAQRVLIPQGHLVITAFNPFSLFGLLKPVLQFPAHSFWRAKWISLLRLKDWLALLGFTVIEVKTTFFRWPCQFLSNRPPDVNGFYEKSCQSLLPYLGSSIVILAQKSVIPLTPIRPKWQEIRKKLVHAEPGLEPTINEARE